MMELMGGITWWIRPVKYRSELGACMSMHDQFTCGQSNGSDQDEEQQKLIAFRANYCVKYILFVT
jgi:hypothetical protein